MDHSVPLRTKAQEQTAARFRARAAAYVPALADGALAILSAGLLLLSFPDFNLWPLAWVALVPLFTVAARAEKRRQAFLLGWMAGTIFFYGSCYWLTHAMIHYGGIPVWVAYALLVPGALVVGLFPAFCCLLLAQMIAGRRFYLLLLAPFIWVALEWARLNVTGQLWNAIGYAQAYVPQLIGAARWGGVYAVGFLIAAVNAAIAYALLARSRRAALAAAAVLIFVALALRLSAPPVFDSAAAQPDAVVVAVQPNVAADFNRSAAEMAALMERHISMSESELRTWEQAAANGRYGQAHNPAELPRVVIWPESPMNFRYARDAGFRQILAGFARRNRVSVLFNSLEPAPLDGAYNAAVMVNEEGRLIAQYDKIRLLPFGEYVPLPRWVPGAGFISGIVGDFTPGNDYPLMPLGQARAGVFICFESAFPSIARKFAAEGADVLINISNDGYLGRTPVMRQHLANAVFRAVENNRPVLRVTNTGISAYISPRGEVSGATEGFQPAARVWLVSRAAGPRTFYTEHGDLFVIACAAISALATVGSKFKAWGPKSGRQTRDRRQDRL